MNLYQSANQSFLGSLMNICSLLDPIKIFVTSVISVSLAGVSFPLNRKQFRSFRIPIIKESWNSKNFG